VQSGAAYAYKRTGSDWAFIQMLKATAPSGSDKAGMDVAIDGTTIALGSILDDDIASNSGAVYMFDYNGTDWGAPTQLKASNTGMNDQFGHAIAIRGDTMVIGAPHEASNSQADPANNWQYGAGAVYVFTRTAGVWTEQAYLKAPTSPLAEGNDFFGRSVALGDGVMIVGAPGEDSAATTIDGNQLDNTSSASGAAYVLTGSGASWTHLKYIKVANASAGDELGGSVETQQASAGVDLDGDTFVVGARMEDGSTSLINGVSDDAAADAGAAYVFK